jgi:NAD(P)-dependent dehydrogenase (short-subunit alcohol dehydrogenase family)
MEIQNNTFFISGGGSGLGAATARRLVQEGAQVVLADINDAAGVQLQEALGSRACFVHTDVTDETSVGRALQLAVEEMGELRGVINCAGVGAAERIVGKRGAHRLDTFVNTLQVNLIGTFNVIRLAAEIMAGNNPLATGERGVIINTASIAAFDGQIGQAAYAASKGGIVAMTLPAARELASAGIRVMAIAPGTFDTPLLAGLPEAARTALGGQVPFPPRLGHPDEFAALAAHIIENAMLNGEVIRLDGALRMPPR